MKRTFAITTISEKQAPQPATKKVRCDLKVPKDLKRSNSYTSKQPPTKKHKINNNPYGPTYFIPSKRDTAMALSCVRSVMYDNYAYIDILLAHNANINCHVSEHKWSPLMVAVLQEKLVMIQFLLERGADMFQVNAYGKSSWCFAQGPRRHLTCLPILQEFNKRRWLKRKLCEPDIPHSSKKQKTMHEELPVFESTLEMFNNLSISEHSQFAKFKKELQTEERITDHESIPPGRMAIACAQAAMSGDIIQMEQLIHKTDNIDARVGEGGWSPLMIAVLNNDQAMTFLLLSNNADMMLENTYSETAWDLGQKSVHCLPILKQFYSK